MTTADEFRHILGHFTTGVTVVTTRDAEGQPRGFTANAFTSLSLTPPLILICVDKRSQTGPFLHADGAVFAINILSAQQEALSRVFASKQPDKFQGIAYREGVTGAPILRDVLAFLECRVVERWSSGDHSVLVGEVRNLGAAPGGAPLLYYRGRYTTMDYTAMETCTTALRSRSATVGTRLPATS